MKCSTAALWNICIFNFCEEDKEWEGVIYLEFGVDIPSFGVYLYIT